MAAREDGYHVLGRDLAIRVRVASEALPMCGSSTVRGATSSRGCTSGSRSYTSSPAAKIARLERVGERLLVDDRARGVFTSTASAS